MDVMEALAAARRAEWEECRKDPEYFVDHYVYIEDKDADELYIPFRMWEGQRQTLRDFANYRLNIVLKARQLGFTWLGLSFSVWLLVFNKGKTVAGVSKGEEEAKELVRRMETILMNLGAFVREKTQAEGWDGPIYEKTAMQICIYFPDGPTSLFKVYASSANVGRSITANLILIDEWAFQENAEKIFKAIFPTINRKNGGKVIGISTIERGTLFEEIFTNPDNKWHKIFLPWYTDPSRDAQWYEDTVGALGKDRTMQEYPATIEEALEVPGGKFFPELLEETHKAPLESLHEHLKARRYVCIDYGLDMLSAHWVAVDAYGKANVYREFDEPNMTIGQAAETILNLSAGDTVDLFLAPPDLWNREQVHGKSRADIFAEHGLTLTKTNNDLAAGCAAIKNWLAVDPGTKKGYLTISDAPNLWRCMQKIQKDEKRPDVYAKQPHSLTHDPDSLRCFCVYWTQPAVQNQPKKKAVWEDDLYEDYFNADSAGQAYMIEKYGDPF